MTNIFVEITNNYILGVVFTAWLSAQVLKTIINFCINKKWEAERLVGSGGMPSSHSALVCSLAVATASQCGFSSTEFALAFSFAVVVMYDAMGVRRAAGEQAKVLNKMMGDWFDTILKHQDGAIDPTAEKLKELLGHTPLEVLGGAILGIVVGLLNIK